MKERCHFCARVALFPPVLSRQNANFAVPFEIMYIFFRKVCYTWFNANKFMKGYLP